MTQRMFIFNGNNLPTYQRATSIGGIRKKKEKNPLEAYLDEITQRSAKKS